MKGTQERGYVLGSVEEIVLTLDDNAMNLQSMSASRFVGPFLEKVQKWEKSLSHISEVVEVSVTWEAGENTCSENKFWPNHEGCDQLLCTYTCQLCIVGREEIPALFLFSWEVV